MNLLGEAEFAAVQRSIQELVDTLNMHNYVHVETVIWHNPYYNREHTNWLSYPMTRAALLDKSHPSYGRFKLEKFNELFATTH